MFTNRRSARRSSRRRRFPTVLVLVLLFVGFVAAAPQIVLKTSLRDRIIQSATADFPASVAVDQVRGGWLSPIVAEGVLAVDESENKLLKVPRVRLESSLLSLLLGGTTDLSFTAEQPQLFLSFDQESSNLERAISDWLQLNTEPSSVAIQVAVRGGTVFVRDSVTSAAWTVEGIEANYRSPDSGHADLDLSATLVTSNDQRGDLQVTYSAREANSSLIVGGNQVALSAFEPIARRFDSELSAMRGSVTGQGELEWGPLQKTVRLEDLAIRDLSVSTSRWLRDESLHVPLMIMGGRVIMNQQTWQVEELRVESEMLKLQARGDGVVSRDATGVAQLLNGLPASHVELGGQIDLAQVAEVIPQTLRLRPGSELTSGIVTFTLASESQGQQTRWRGNLDAEHLAARDSRQAYSWDDPLRIVVTALHAEESWRVEELMCEGSFVAATASGSLEQGALSFEGDLSRFAAEAGQFFELDPDALAGQVAGTASWQRLDGARIALNASAQTQGFRWNLAGGLPWREPALRLEMSCEAETRDHQVAAIVQGSAQLVSGADQCEVALTAPVALQETSTAWPLRIGLQGELATWLPRLQYFVPTANTALEGQIWLTTEGVVTESQLEIQSADGRIQELSGQLAGLQIAEPHLEVQLAGSWQLEEQRGRASHFTCASSTVAFRAEDVALEIAPAFSVSGRVGYRADLARISTYVGSPRYRLQGELSGHAEFVDDGRSTRLSGDAEAVRFVLAEARDLTGGSGVAAASHAPTWQTVWTEDSVRVSTRAEFDRHRGDVQLERVEVTSATLNLGASGTMTDVAGRCDLDLSGEVAYDLRRLTEHLGRERGLDVNFTGAVTQPFSFQGPLRFGELEPSHDTQFVAAHTPAGWARFAAASKFGWDTASIYGVTMGAGLVDAQLADGLMNLRLHDVEVGRGKVRLATTIDMRQDPILLTLPGGILAEDVEIDPNMCQTWLKYLAPLVADATAVRGEVSISIQDSTVPLDAIANGNLRGVLDVHSAQVGPGQLATQFLTVAERLRSLLRQNQQSRQVGEQWVHLPTQRIAFHTANGRVYHEGLQFVVDDVRVVTSGSVGLDQSMSLVATVLIPDEWVTSDRWLSSLRGQKLQIPIQGTLGAPRLDARALDQMATQFIGGAAGRLLEQELGRGLQRLLGPRE